MGFYDRHILPHIIRVGMGVKPIAKQREKVVPLAQGRVLEIGVGAGHNFAYYDRAKVEKLWGLEPDPQIRKYAAQQAAVVNLDVEFIDLPGEEIPLDDDSVDTVLTTFTLCTIPDAEKALQGMRRVLKPDGRLIFCEHGQAPDKKIEVWQNRIEPIWKCLFGGCHLTRNPVSLLDHTGFKTEKVETMYLPSTPRIAAFNYWGTAIPN